MKHLLVDPRYGDVMRVDRNGTDRAAVRKDGIELQFVFSPEDWEIRTDRQDHGYVLSEHLIHYAPHRFAGNEPRRAERESVSEKEKVQTCSQCETVDAELGHNGEVPA